MGRHGMTLVEVLLALAVMGVLLLSVLGIQAAALRHGAEGVATQEALRRGRAFLESLRASDLPASCPKDGASIPLGRDIQGRCSSVPCLLAQGGGLACDASLGAGDAYLVRLEAPAEAPRMRLERVVRP